MAKKQKKFSFDKSPLYCDVTGKHHKWRFKMHGIRAFPTECTDCGKKAEELMADIVEQTEKADEEGKIAEEMAKKQEEKNKVVEQERINE